MKTYLAFQGVSSGDKGGLEGAVCSFLLATWLIGACFVALGRFTGGCQRSPDTLSSLSLLHCTDILIFQVCFYYVLCQMYTFEVEVEKNCTCKTSNWIISIDRWTLWTDRQSDSSITPFSNIWWLESKCDIVITLPLSTGLILGLGPANETSLQSNAVSHWLGANLESARR